MVLRDQRRLVVEVMLSPSPRACWPNSRTLRARTVALTVSWASQVGRAQANKIHLHIASQLEQPAASRPGAALVSPYSVQRLRQLSRRRVRW